MHDCVRFKPSDKKPLEYILMPTLPSWILIGSNLKNRITPWEFQTLSFQNLEKDLGLTILNLISHDTALFSA